MQLYNRPGRIVEKMKLINMHSILAVVSTQQTRAVINVLLQGRKQASSFEKSHSLGQS